MSAKKSCSVCGNEFEPNVRFCPNDGTPLRAMEATDPLIGQTIADRYRGGEVVEVSLSLA